MVLIARFYCNIFSGTFTFKATCCNTKDLCESATSADTITVEPVNIAAEEASGDILKQVKIAVKAGIVLMR